MSRTVTILLRDWRNGDQAALEELLPLIYAELHKVAAAYTRGEHHDQALRPTELVAEAYLRLAEGQAPEWKDRVHFYGIAARTMRQILVDHARKRTAAKRGSDAPAVSFDEGLVSGERPSELVALDDALVALASFDERKARIVELHYFGGLTQPEVAEVIEVHVNTVARDLRIAEAWIGRFLRETT